MPVLYIENIISVLKKLNFSMLSPFFCSYPQKMYSKQSLFKTYVIICYAFMAMLSGKNQRKYAAIHCFFLNP